MGIWDKFKITATPVAKVASVLAPGKAGDIARMVDQVIENDRDPQNLGALRALADEIVELKMRVAHLEDVLTRRAR